MRRAKKGTTRTAKDMANVPSPVKAAEENGSMSLPDVTDNDLRQAGIVAYKIAEAYMGYVEWYKKTYELSHHEAIVKVGDISPEYVANIMKSNPDRVSWFQLSSLIEADPELFKKRWTSLVRMAREEFETGQTAAMPVMEGGIDTPWARIRFLAIRQAMVEEWQPRGGIEIVLIDMLTNAYWEYLRWLEILVMRTTFESSREKGQISQSGKWQLPYIGQAESQDQAAQMVDRFNRLFMRTLRGLRDLRRYDITIQNVGQVNIGDKQVNLVGAPKSAKELEGSVGPCTDES